tara:strand:+ start:8191 stop:8379 length:189 start_codon:yes stop_codon:yes gene_type:complete
MSELEHIVHACFLVVVAYLVMIYLLKQSSAMASTRSIALGAFAGGYMLLFGHKAPSMSVFKN